MKGEAMQSLRGPSCPPAFALEAAVAGEAPSAELATHLPTCASCRGYLEALREAQEEFLRERPAELFLRQLSRRESRTPRRRWWWTLALPVAALAGALLVVRPGGDSFRAKGGAFAVFYKREGMGSPAQVTPDLELRAGDALRFSYEAPRDGHLLILDLDGSGKVTAFHPFEGERSQPVGAGPALVPRSVVLDAAPGPEWLVAVFSTEPLLVAPLARQLAEHAPGTPIELRCDNCRVESLRIQKAR